jgi:hypothetical protein
MIQEFFKKSAMNRLNMIADKVREILNGKKFDFVKNFLRRKNHFLTALISLF